MRARGRGEGPSSRWPLRWPLPALAAWIAAWAIHLALQPSIGAVASGVAGSLAGLSAAAWLASTAWRRAIVALGFPISLLATGAASPWL